MTEEEVFSLLRAWATLTLEIAMKFVYCWLFVS